MKTIEQRAQEIAEQTGERFRSYLDLVKIQRRIDRPHDPCGPMKGSDGHKMLAQEFIGNLLRDALEQVAREQREACQQALGTVPQIVVGGSGYVKTAQVATAIRKAGIGG